MKVHGVGPETHNEYPGLLGQGESGEVCLEARMNYPDEFEVYWLTTAKRDGKRLGKRNTFKFWEAEIAGGTPAELLEKASKGYAVFCEKTDRPAKDPQRFISQGIWEDFADEPEEIEMVQTDAETARAYYESIGRENIVQRIDQGDPPGWVLIVPKDWKEI